MGEMRKKSPKKLVKDLFDLKDMTHPMYIPLLYRYASRISRVPVDEMLRNPSDLSRGLIMAQELFGYDGIVTNYDNYLGIEVLAGSFDWVNADVIDQLVSRNRSSPVAGRAIGSAVEVGSVPVVYESTAQICEIVGRDIPVIGVLNSPITLAGIILGDEYPLQEGHRDRLRGPLNDIQAITLDLIKAYCNHRVDVIWIIEEDWSRMGNAEIEWLRPLYETFWNVTDYYDVKSIMAFHDYDAGNIERYFTMGSDGVFFGGGKAATLSTSSLAGYADDAGVCVGIGCPFAENGESTARVEELAGSIREIGHGFFLSTPWEVHPETPAEVIHETIEMIKD